jgi:hypothetical protein
MDDAQRSFNTREGPRFSNAAEISFCDFDRKYDGQSCYIIGRGPTDFDYEKLVDVREPIFFINDAVSLEKYARSDTYFFAHDAQMLPWMNGAVRSTIVVPIDGKVFRQTPGIELQHTGNIVFYHWREEKKEELLTMTRAQIAEAKQLYTHTGTIHSVLHFIWFCGFKRVTFIGCDCISLPERLQTVDGYDSRLANLSQSASSFNYMHIGKAQLLLLQLFGLESTYIGTPPSQFCLRP